MVTHQIYARSCPNLLSWDDFSTAVRTVQGESLALILVSLKTFYFINFVSLHIKPDPKALECLAS